MRALFLLFLLLLVIEIVVHPGTDVKYKGMLTGRPLCRSLCTLQGVPILFSISNFTFSSVDVAGMVRHNVLPGAWFTMTFMVRRTLCDNNTHE